MQTCAFFKTFHVGLSIQYGCVEQHLVRKTRRLWVVVERVECGCNADNSAVTNWQWLLHKFGLCTLFLKSFLALKRAFGQHKWFFNKTEPFFFYWAVSHSPYQTFFHFSSPRWIRLPQEKKKSPRNPPRNNFFPYCFLGKGSVSAIVWWNGAKLLSVLGAWCLNLVNTTAETTLLCLFMDKRHCNCISSRLANELFNHLHMDVL